MASLVLEIKSELPKAIKWTNEHTKQLPFSLSQALNATAKGSKFLPGSERKSMVNASRSILRNNLDRPKPSTGLRATTATKRNLQLSILPKDRPYPSNKYIQGNIQGGNRPVKEWELRLQKAARNTFPSGSRLIPTSNLGSVIDRFGNVPKSTINNIAQNMSTKYKGGGFNYFAGKPKGGNRPHGVYRRFATNNRLQAVFIAMPVLTYKRSLTRLEPELERQAQSNFGSYLRHFLHRNVAAEMRRGTADTRTGIFF